MNKKGKYVGRCTDCGMLMMDADLGMCPHCGKKHDLGILPDFEIHDPSYPLGTLGTEVGIKTTKAIDEGKV